MSHMGGESYAVGRRSLDPLSNAAACCDSDGGGHSSVVAVACSGETGADNDLQWGRFPQGTPAAQRCGLSHRIAIHDDIY